MKEIVNDVLNKFTSDLKKSVTKEVSKGKFPSPSVFFITNDDDDKKVLNIGVFNFEGSVSEHTQKFKKVCKDHNCFAVCFLTVFDAKISFVVETPANYFVSIGEIIKEKFTWNDQVFSKDHPSTKSFARIVEDVVH
jgi:hypothetical protein